MSANGHLRLAWQADCLGNLKLRDVMLTLALAETESTDPWVERCRTKLVRDRAGHFFSNFPTLAEALGHEAVRNALERLREKYPPARVEWLLLAADSSQGRFTGRKPSLAILLNDLLGTPAEAEVRRDPPELIRGPVARSRSTATAPVSVPASGTEAAAVPSRVGVFFPGGHSVVDATPLGFGGAHNQSPEPARLQNSSRAGVTSEIESASSYYLAVLFSMALLLSMNPQREISGEWRKAG